MTLHATTNNTSSQKDTSSTGQLRQQRINTFLISLVSILLITGFVVGLVFLLNPNLSQDGTVARIRDVFIIVMALESIIIGAALVILVIQLARLSNLIQNEVKPILDSTNETVNTLRGTAAFLSDNFVEPVMKLNEYIAALYRILELLGIKQKK